MQPALPSPSLPIALWVERTALFGPLKYSSAQAVALRPPACSAIAERLLALLASSGVRKGSLEAMQPARCFPTLLQAIHRCVHAGKPVQLTLMAFPFKVPNLAKTGPRRTPDLAELISLARLSRLNEKAKCIYPPGLEIHLIHDGAYIAPVFGVSLEEVRGYESYFSQMIRAAGMDRFIRLYDLQTLPFARLNDSGQQRAELRDSIRVWRRDSGKGAAWSDRFSKTLGMMNLRELPLGEACRLLDHATSGALPPEYAGLERRVRITMLRYHALDSLLHRRDPRPFCFPDAIHATTQCRERRLAIWLVSRGHSLLPWHGVGVIDRHGKLRVVLAREVLGDPSYRPVSLEGEDTPFYYQQDD